MNLTDSRDLARRRDCFCPVSFKTVSMLDVLVAWNIPICPCMMPCLCYQRDWKRWGYVLFRFAMTDDEDLSLSIAGLEECLLSSKNTTNLA